MNCSKTQELLSPYLDGELDAAEAAVVEEHLQTCTDCREDFATTKKTIALFQGLSLEEIQAPKAIKAGVMAGIQELETELQSIKRKWLLPAVAAAAVLLALFWSSGLFEQIVTPPAQIAQSDQRSEASLKQEAAVGEANEIMQSQLPSEEKMSLERFIEPEAAGQSEEKVEEETQMNIMGFDAAQSLQESDQVFSITGGPADQLDVVRVEIKLFVDSQLKDELWQQNGAVVLQKTSAKVEVELPQLNLDKLLKAISEYGRIEDEKRVVDDLSNTLREARTRLLDLEKQIEVRSNEELTSQRALVAELESRKGKAFLTINLH